MILQADNEQMFLKVFSVTANLSSRKVSAQLTKKQVELIIVIAWYKDIILLQKGRSIFTNGTPQVGKRYDDEKDLDDRKPLLLRPLQD